MYSMYEVYTTAKKILKIRPQYEITTYLFYSLPMSTFLWDDSKYPWLLNHFTNVYLDILPDGYLSLDYLERDDFCTGVMEFRGMDLNETKKIHDIISFIKEKISAGCYVKLVVDRYFIRDSNSHAGEHYPLQIFIYGYDEINTEFLGIGFGEDFRFKLQTYTYDEVENAFFSFNTGDIVLPTWAKWYSCILYYPTRKEGVCFDLQMFITNLDNYVNSYSKYDMLRPDIAHNIKKEVSFGLKTHKDIMNALELMLNNDVRIDYRHIHLISEHKKQMLKKMTYISSLFHYDNRIKSDIEVYKKIAQEYENVRITYMKDVLKYSKFTDLFSKMTNKDSLVYMHGVFDKNIELEYETLTDFLKVIS